jgi:hypothetical protein
MADPSKHFGPRRCAKIALAFKAAQPYLWVGVGDFRNSQVTRICRALQVAYSHGEIKWTPEQDACDIVMARLNPSATVDGYVLRRLGVLSCTDAQLQAFRHRWVNELIREFTARGKE